MFRCSSSAQSLSLFTVFLGHGTALISVATTEIFAGLQKLDRAQEEASLDLGATPWQTFWRVTLPNLQLSLIAAGLLIFTLSMDEIAVTFFLIGRDNTLPLEIWATLAPRHHSGNQCHLHADLRRLRRLDRGLVSHPHPRNRRIRAGSSGSAVGGFMPNSRRDFIKFVVAGSVAAGCPIDLTLLPASVPSTSPSSLLHGEHFDVCHQIRDGHRFDHPAPARNVDIVIVGGGVAGLSAAYFLRGKDFLLLEKEDHFGGNAYQEEYDGQPFGTGSAYAYKGDYGDHLAAEIGLHLLPVDIPTPPSSTKPSFPTLGMPVSLICLTPNQSAIPFSNFATTC